MFLGLLADRFGRCCRVRTSAAAVYLLLSPLVVTPTPGHSQGMTLPGSFAVSASGAATYAVPIALPPSTAGMGPSLSLEYSSQGSNGILGIGWSLGGLPSIGRCPRTMAQDGVVGGINYDANDRFCMDGQRLVTVNGTYGADGAQYRTEIDGFSKIISHGAAGSGPAWFEVHTKSGQTLEFGNTTDSRILAQGKSSAQNWTVNRVSDTKTNFYTVTYTNDAANGQYYPTRIDYTGNASASVSPYNSVQFTYASRPDIVPMYQSGSLSQTTLRLTDIKTYTGATLIGDYKLTYQQSGAANRTRLTIIAVCDGAATPVCLPATTLTWQDSTDGMSTKSNLAGVDGYYVGWRASFGDFNGDGKTDILWDDESGYADGRSSGHRILWLGNGDGTFTVIQNVAGNDGYYVGWRASFGDFNGDGKTDILWDDQSGYADGRSSGHRILWLGNGDGTFTVIQNVAGNDGNYVGWRALLGDFNGDGKTDILWDDQSGYADGRSSGHRILWLGNGDGTFSVSQNVAGSDGYFIGWRALLGDFNGDGKADILWDDQSGYADGRSSGHRILWLGSGDGTFAANPNVANTDGYFIGWRALLGDFNGDGKTDVLWDDENGYADGRSSGHRTLWLGKGDGTFSASQNVASNDGYFIGWRALLGDFNGDGKTDILWDDQSGYSDGRSSGHRTLWLGNGNGTFAAVANFTGNDGFFVGWRALLGDFNGDGKTDILWDDESGYADGRSSGHRTLWLTDGVAPDLLGRITTGLGATTSITYTALTSNSVYTKDTTASYPVQDLQAPFYVVSRVDAANGIGGTYSSTYSYAGAKLNLAGRGFLGFRQMAVKDLQTNIVDTSVYRQDFPYIGMVASTSRTFGAQTLGQQTNTYQFVNASGGTTISPSGAPYRLSLSQSVSGNSDLDGSALPTTTSTYQSDAFNNTTQVTVSTSDGFSKTTTNTYTNDVTNWYLGRLTRATVTSVAP